MPDGFVRMRVGEKRPIYGQATAATGTLTISGSPTYTLYDKVGTVVAGPLGVTGYDVGALAAPRVWTDLDTAALAAGRYTLVFSFVATGSDAIVRTYEPEVTVEVQPKSAAPDYTQWPAVFDIEAKLTACGITPRVNDPSYRQRVIDGVVAEIERLTLRQWVADSVDVTRVYDGSGTAELEVDEFVSFTAVVAIGAPGDPGYTMSNVAPIVELRKPLSRLVVARGGLPAFATEAVWAPYHYVFPAGRQNVQVTAKWGYGATIPVDLWLAVQDEAAAREAEEAAEQGSGRGRLTRLTEGDVTKQWDVKGGWIEGAHRRFADAISRYKRRDGRRLRRLRPAMI